MSKVIVQLRAVATLVFMTAGALVMLAVAVPNCGTIATRSGALLVRLLPLRAPRSLVPRR